MTWHDEAACSVANGEHPADWDEAGSMHAHYVCLHVCTVRVECLTDALRERPQGQMRAGVVFATRKEAGASKVARRPLALRYEEHREWHQMWLDGMSYKAIGEKVSRHHTTVRSAVMRVEIERRQVVA